MGWGEGEGGWGDLKELDRQTRRSQGHSEFVCKHLLNRVMGGPSVFKQCLRVSMLKHGCLRNLSLGQNQPMGQYLAFPPSPGPNGNAN